MVPLAAATVFPANSGCAALTSAIRLSVSGRELGQKKVRRDFLAAAAAAVEKGATPADYREYR